MGRYGHFVIDADGHGGEPADWQDRLPARFQPQMEARRERIKQQFANLVGVGVMQTKGTARPRRDFPMLADLYLAGRLKIDELITRRYALDDFATALEDLKSGSLARGVFSLEERSHG